MNLRTEMAIVAGKMEYRTWGISEKEAIDEDVKILGASRCWILKGFVLQRSWQYWWRRNRCVLEEEQRVAISGKKRVKGIFGVPFIKGARNGCFVRGGGSEGQ